MATGTYNSDPTGLINVNGVLYFFATDVIHGVEPWLTHVNHAPTATNLSQVHTIAEDSGALNLTDIVVTDVDTGDTITATLTLSNASVRCSFCQ